MKKKPIEPSVEKPIKQSLFQKYKLALIPLLLGIALYFNTIDYGFVLDDGLVTQDTYINQGLKNVADLFTQKTLPEVGNIKPYRPITSVSFALDYSLFDSGNPINLASKMHLMNVLYYALALFLTFILSKKLFKNNTIALGISLVFAAHPIHTEVVANIKSRDEILAYLFGIIALLFYLKFIEIKQKKWLILSFFAYFLAVLSKESALLFLAIFPFINYYASENKLMNWNNFKDLKLLIIPAILYLLLQKIILGSNFMPQMTDIDNMLVGITNSSENLATRFYIVGMYLYKMIFPHPLLYDYSINYLSKKTFASWEVWLSLVAITSLIYFIIKGIFVKNKIAFGLLFMFVMFILTCNLFIPIGATFAERFAFTPSLGFAIALVFLLVELQKKITQNPKAILVFTMPILALYSLKTFSRNQDWKDNATLFTHDYEASSKSLRVQNNYASVFYLEAKNTTDTIAKKKLFLKSISTLDEVTNQYPNYVEAYIQKGIMYLELKDCENSVSNFETARKIGTYNYLIESNLALAYINCGKPNEALAIFQTLLKKDTSLTKFYLKNVGISHFNLKNIDSASYYFSKLKQEYPDDTEVDSYIKLVADYKAGNLEAQKNPQTQVASTVDVTPQFNEANSLYQKGDKSGAEKILKQCIAANPNHALSFALLGIIADDKQEFSKAVDYYKKSIVANPGDYRIYFNLGNTYLKIGKDEKAIQTFEKCISIAPTYKNPYQSLTIYYKAKNNLEKASYYEQKLKALN